MKEIQNSADFIYTDEMKFEKKIEDSIDIVCKSGFGKDELRSHNYICHFVVFKKQLLDNMTEFYRREYEGSQDYDMVLRLTEKAEKIVHIPKALSRQLRFRRQQWYCQDNMDEAFQYICQCCSFFPR